MGWTPGDVGRASVWQFQSALSGWRRAHDPKGDRPGPPSDEEYYAVIGAY